MCVCKKECVKKNKCNFVGGRGEAEAGAGGVEGCGGASAFDGRYVYFVCEILLLNDY